MGNLHNELKRLQDKLIVASPKTTVTGIPVTNSDLTNARIELAALLRSTNKMQAYECILALREDIQSMEAAIKNASILKANDELARLHRELREIEARKISTRKSAELESKRLLDAEKAHREEQALQQELRHQTALRERATTLVALGQVATCEECKQGKSTGTCPVCMGTGHVSARQVTHYRAVVCNNNSPNCLRCGGTGIFQQTYIKLEDVCERCIGKGVIPTTCHRCAGHGIVKLNRSPIDPELAPFLIRAFHERHHHSNETVANPQAQMYSNAKAPATTDTRAPDSTGMGMNSKPKEPATIESRARDPMRTRWFSISEKPVRKGHYETTIHGSSYVAMSFWDGSTWTNKLPFGPTPGQDSWWRWRGLIRNLAKTPVKQMGGT
jgi:hypothetical protein